MKCLTTLALLFAASIPTFAAATYASNSEWAEAVYYANSYADHYGVPRALVHAVIEQESGWNPHAVSSKGALGIMQLMPGTAQQLGVRDPFSVSENIGAGTRYLASLLVEFHGEIRLAVAAYYCGNHPIQHRGLQYSNPDVFRYVSSVRNLYIRDLRRHQVNDPTISKEKTINQ